MRWWARTLLLCAAVVVVAGCDLRPVSDHVSLIDTFAVPSSVEQPRPRPVEDLPEDIPRVVAEPIEADEAAGGGVPGGQAPSDGNPNEHRSLADREQPGEPSVSDPTAAPTAAAPAGPGDDATPEAGRDEPTGPVAGGRDGQPAAGDDPAPPGDGDDVADGPAAPASAGRGEPTVRRSARPAPAEAPTVPLSVIEREIADLLNAERAAAGLDPVRVDARLTHGARAWATTMARGGAFTHESEGGFSENIAYGYADAAEVHAAWMASPGHRGNRMRPDVGAYGVGVGAAGTTLYFVERFQ